MENERDPEVIRRQMQQTRNHLTEKVEAVENLVTNTVKETAEAVSETVSEVKEAVSDTVEGVRKVFDFRGHIQSHPWLMFFGVTGLSFLATKLVLGRAQPRSRDEWGASTRSAAGAGTYGEAAVHRAATPAVPPPRQEEEGPGWLSGLLERLAPSATKVKEMGLGYTMALVDQLITGSMPDQWRGGVHDLFDTLTTSLGGKPMKQWATSANGSGSRLPDSTTQGEAPSAV